MISHFRQHEISLRRHNRLLITIGCLLRAQCLMSFAGYQCLKVSLKHRVDLFSKCKPQATNYCSMYCSSPRNGSSQRIDPLRWNLRFGRSKTSHVRIQ